MEIKFLELHQLLNFRNHQLSTLSGNETREVAVNTNRVTKLSKNLRSPNHKIVIQAIKDLRSYGWLEDGTLEGINLRHAHLQGTDLFRANFQKADLRMAHLQLTNLTKANLEGALLSSADLYGADLNHANLKNTSLFKANLLAARNLKTEQLAQVRNLWGAIMPDGSLYDGRFNLPADLAFARGAHIDIDDPRAMAEFYRSSEEITFTQYKSSENNFTGHSTMQLIRKLRHSDNVIVNQAIDELRARGHLTDGSLRWMYLRYVNFQGVDLSGADLNKTDLNMAKLQRADLRGANLEDARLRKANMRGALFAHTTIKGASLAMANLHGISELTEQQLAQARRLRGATMPDGSRYNGRFNLAGDLADARFLHINIDDAQAMANFYGISIAEYQTGQIWMKEHMPFIWAEVFTDENRLEFVYDLENLIGLDRDISN
ncbi:MAG TPA: pentapeptide repeat-containing protein [Anaerolineae bacterium]|nr:pentapeptide repeat-containing protein [Anaerolineae bacterium]